MPIYNLSQAAMSSVMVIGVIANAFSARHLTSQLDQKVPNIYFASTFYK